MPQKCYEGLSFSHKNQLINLRPFTKSFYLPNLGETLNPDVVNATWNGVENV